MRSLDRKSLSAVLLNLFVPGVGYSLIGKTRAAVLACGIFSSTVLLTAFMIYPPTVLLAYADDVLFYLLRLLITLYLFFVVDTFFIATEQMKNFRSRYNLRLIFIANLALGSLGYFLLRSMWRGVLYSFISGGLLFITIRSSETNLFPLELLFLVLAIDGCRVAYLKNKHSPETKRFQASVEPSDNRPSGYSINVGLFSGLLVFAIGMYCVSFSMITRIPDYSRPDRSAHQLSVNERTTVFHDPQFGVTFGIPLRCKRMQIRGAESLRLTCADDSFFLSLYSENYFSFTTSMNDLMKLLESELEAGGVKVLHSENKSDDFQDVGLIQVYEKGASQILSFYLVSSPSDHMVLSFVIQTHVGMISMIDNVWRDILGSLVMSGPDAKPYRNINFSH